MEKTITKENIQEKLKIVAENMRKSKDMFEQCAKSQKDLDQVKSHTLIEMTKLQGEERALKELLSTVDTPEKEDKK